MSKSSVVHRGRIVLQRMFVASVIGLLVYSLISAPVAEWDASSEPTSTPVFPSNYRTRAEDCPSCHNSVVETLAAGKHDWIDCDLCHDPDIKAELHLITECMSCHGEMHGYNLTQSCTNCHDAHATGFGHDVDNSLCQTCHLNQTSHLDMGPHGWQDCTGCHSKHKTVTNECDKCHGVKHTDWIEDGYRYPDCLDCHNPMEATFKHNLSNEICSDCHSSEFSRLQVGGHSAENCSDCHDEHQMVTKTCDECHGEYHGYSYPKCLECHEPMQAASGTPQEEIPFDIVLFSVVATLASVVISIGLVFFWRKSEE